MGIRRKTGFVPEMESELELLVRRHRTIASAFKRKPIPLKTWLLASTIPYNQCFIMLAAGNGAAVSTPSPV